MSERDDAQLDAVDTHRGAFFRVLQGEAIVRVGPRERRAGAGTLITIPAGATHHVRNLGATPLFFVTVYAPPEY